MMVSDDRSAGGGSRVVSELPAQSFEPVSDEDRRRTFDSRRN